MLLTQGVLGRESMNWGTLVVVTWAGWELGTLQKVPGPSQRGCLRNT